MTTYRKTPLAPSSAAPPRRFGRSSASSDISGPELLHHPVAAASGSQADLLTGVEQAPASPLPAARELPQMLTIAELADMFGRSPRTIRSWIARGLIRRVKVGNAVFIPMTEIDALLSSEISRSPAG